jgi:hypothetical protein
VVDEVRALDEPERGIPPVLALEPFHPAPGQVALTRSDPAGKAGWLGEVDLEGVTPGPVARDLPEGRHAPRALVVRAAVTMAIRQSVGLAEGTHQSAGSVRGPHVPVACPITMIHATRNRLWHLL